MKTLPALLCLGLLAARLPAQSVEPANTVIESEQFDWRSADTETTSVFTGRVVVTATNLRLSCDRLEIIALRKADPTATIGKIEGFKSMVATGNVRIIQGDREAACGRAEVLPGDNKIILTGQPVVVDRSVNWTWTGDELEMLRGERQIRGKNARFTGPPIKDLGVDLDKKLAPANEPAPATPPPAQP
ncbi:OstA-like protein [Lacunisphaera limnophila]|uniref:OstA-like protein n=1 Tax=Lacunisphaera limnophila TaxID=1838286 RepID=A0A1D8AWK0_9BACT|nr:LptA/OstA family protein [Lacunisphaera limnophila]AOS45266.1 OstA-like protein [Lacunisphaera limnophila]